MQTTDTFSWLLKRFSPKVSLANADTLLPIVRSNKRFFFKGKKTFSWCNDHAPSATVHWIGQIIEDNILDSDFDISRVMQRMAIGYIMCKEQLCQDFWVYFQWT